MYTFVASKVNLYSYKLRRGWEQVFVFGVWTAIKGAHTKTVVCRFTVRFRICLLIQLLLLLTLTLKSLFLRN